MKKTMLASVLIAAALGEVAAQAQTFTYNPGDVLAAFRNGGANDLVVDLGSVANFQTPGYTTSLNLASDLTTAFGTLNGLYWSVFTYDANGTYAPANTVFMSDPQATVGVPNAPLSISSSQVTVGNQIQSLVNALSPTYGTVIDNQVIELPSSIGSTTGGNPAASYTVAAGPNADFNGTYGHNFENVSSTSATTASDLFQENPGERHSAVAAQNLGTITLDAAGNLSFQATPEPSTMAMVGTGLMSLIAFRRFAKKTNSRKNNYIHLKHNQKKQINNMKNTCLLAALGAVLATVPVMAANYDLYITGSTAFRPQVQSACYKMFDGGAPTSQIDSTGANPIPANDANAWSMSGTAANLGITSGSDTLTIHAFFTGSVQGLHAIENNDLLGFVGPATSSTIVSNYATIAFSDVYSKYTIAPLNLANFKEDDVAVQPFVFVKSKAPSGVASIQNVSFQQIITIMQNSGQAPLSFFTGNYNDYTTNVTILHRNLDSGTRVSSVLEDKVTGSLKVWYYDSVGKQFTNSTAAGNGDLGPVLYGPGYTSGGNVRKALQYADAQNQSIAYLSLADAQTITSTNWSNILRYNGNLPVANWTPTNPPAGGTGQVGTGLATTNDFSPVCNGQYTFWATEELAYPGTSTQWGHQSGQNLSYTQLGTIISVLEGQYTGTALPGSLDYEIVLSQTAAPYATAIRLGDMNVGRTAVGGIITP